MWVSSFSNCSEADPPLWTGPCFSQGIARLATNTHAGRLARKREGDGVLSHVSAARRPQQGFHP